MAGAVVVGATATRYKWTVGANTAQQTISGDFPITQDVNAVTADLASAPILVQPNGQPWTVAAINALTNVQIEQDYAPSSGQVYRSALNACFIDVYAPIGAVGPPVQFKVTGIAGPNTIGGVAGPAVITATETGALKLKTPLPTVTVP